MVKKQRERFATGMSIADIMSMSISKLQSYSTKIQREISSRLISAANKRVKNLEKNNVNTPALSKLKRSGDKLSVRGKAGEMLISEFIRARDFLKSKTSSLKEWRKIEKKIKDEMSDYVEFKQDKNADKVYISMSEIYNIFDDVRDYDATLTRVIPSKQLLAYMANLAENGMNRDEIYTSTISWLESKYEELQKSESAYTTRFAHGLGD